MNKQQAKIETYRYEAKEFMAQKPIVLQLTAYMDAMMEWAYASGLAMGSILSERVGSLTPDERNELCDPLSIKAAKVER